MQKYNIIAVHGFLGESSDWSAVKQHTPEQCNWICIDLFKSTNSILGESALKQNSLQQAAENILQMLPETIHDTDQNIFIGYSLGARIGLHLLESYSHLFSKFILVSCHPGLTSANDKSERRKSDDLWIEKLNNCKNIEEFWIQWLQQPVFNSDRELKRNFSDYAKDKLTSGLSYLSLAEQKDMRNLIEKNQNKINWVVGDADKKFCEIAEELKQKKILSSYERIFNSGHRVLFDQPSVLADFILK